MNTQPQGHGGARWAWLSTDHRIFKGIGAVLALVGLVTVMVAGVQWVMRILSRAPIEAYLTTNPSRLPELQSTEHDLLGIREGMSLDDIKTHFGDDVQVANWPSYSDDEWRAVGFTGKGVTVTVLVQESTEATRPSAVSVVGYDTMNPKGSREEITTYASLPHGLLLGYSTTADVLEKTAADLHTNWVEGLQWTTLRATVQQVDGFTPIEYHIDHGFASAPGATVSPWGTGAEKQQLSPEACQDVVTSFSLPQEGEMFPLGQGFGEATPAECT